MQAFKSCQEVEGPAATVVSVIQNPVCRFCSKLCCVWPFVWWGKPNNNKEASITVAVVHCLFLIDGTDSNNKRQKESPCLTPHDVGRLITAGSVTVTILQSLPLYTRSRHRHAGTWKVMATT